MDLRRCGFVLLLILVAVAVGVAEANVVFKVHHKYGARGGERSSLAALRDHDNRRHGRNLAAIDFQLGGNGLPTDTALYYTKLSIGTPPKDYHVQVDTGSDILWVNCAGCDKCPTKSSLGIKLTPYDLDGSSTGKAIGCDSEFCSVIFNGISADCKVGMQCEFAVTYGDGSQTAGYFVRDTFRFDQISGNSQTSYLNGSVAFGCSNKQSGELGSSTEAVDGIIGFGQSNSSIISQLASTKKTKRIFSHCLDSEHGGGIFAMGQVVEPKVKTTPMIPNQPHYNVLLKSIEVGGDALELSSDPFDSGAGTGAIIDSGTTLAYLPNDVYDALMTKVMGANPGMKTHTIEEQFTCFFYKDSIDKKFPTVTFHFENSATLNAYAHDYLFQISEGEYCVGWQNKAMQTRDGKQVTLLGDIVLSDKLFVYDLENQTIGWAEYNCSSNIKVKDETTGNVYSVGAHDISSVSRINAGNTFTIFSSLAIIIIMLGNFIG